MVKSTFQVLLFSLISFQISVAQDSLVYESSGLLSTEQASFNVHYYDLDVKVDPSEKTVGGTVGIYFDVVHPTNVIELALDPRLEIESISQLESDESLKFTRNDSSKQVMVYFPMTLQPGEKSAVAVTYSGQPIEAENPPWDGGMVWDQTPSGEHWVGVATQTIGAWTWWPNKDHLSDKADSVSINLTMPDDLTVVSNGRSRGTTDLEDGWKTWHWYVSTPINNYNITVNAAPYEVIRETYTSVAGDEMEISFWVLPDFMEEGKELFPQFAEQIEFLEKILGPYPFRADKYGVAHAPFLGMEHQTLIAYGANFENGNLFGLDIGFDDLHQHELAHEWWGNHITAWDWRDFWIHEGFGTYMQALYAEELKGRDTYNEMIELFKNRISGQSAIAPRESHSSREIRGVGRGGDVYYKGAVFLHTLRFYIGDDAFFESLRRFSYPDPEMESVTDGSQNRFATTGDFLHVVESITNQDLSWLFEVYLRQAELPKLDVLRRGNVIRMQWSTQEGTEFPMPIELKIGDERVNIVPENGAISLEVAPGVDVEIDPDGLILMNISFRES